VATLPRSQLLPSSLHLSFRFFAAPEAGASAPSKTPLARAPLMAAFHYNLPKFPWAKRPTGRCARSSYSHYNTPNPAITPQLLCLSPPNGPQMAPKWHLSTAPYPQNTPKPFFFRILNPQKFLSLDWGPTMPNWFVRNF